VDAHPRVAEIPVEPAVGAEDEAVGRVVVLRLAGPGEEQLFFGSFLVILSFSSKW
jgi:hypothetical protein